MSVAIETGGDIALSQFERLAVEGLAVVLDAFFVAVPAAVAAGELEGDLVGMDDFVRGMAIGADGGVGVAFCDERAVDACFEGLEDPDMTLAAGFGNFVSVDGRIGVIDRMHRVGGVAVSTSRCRDQPTLGDRLAVGALEVGFDV